jgi:tRNA threonylcarbamoyladenosine biosynthesis protein TsaE
MKAYITHSPEETEEAGRKFSERLLAGSVVVLTGELGAGKTVFVKGIARGMGVKGYIKSPSFTIVNVYEEGRLPLYHIDLYRIERGIEGLGLEEYIYGRGVAVIEWGEKAEAFLPEGAIRVRFFYEGEDARRIEVDSEGI